MIKYVIFDMGGVIIRWNDEWLIGEIARKYHANRKKVEKSFFKWAGLSWTGEITEMEFLRRVAKDAGIDAKPTDMQNIWKTTFRKKSSLNYGVVGLLKQIHKNGYKMAIISNTSANYRAQAYAKSIKKYFKVMVMSCNVGMKKPERGIFTYTMKKMGSKPKEFVFVDDRRVNAEGARKIGMKAIHYNSIPQLRRDLRKAGVTI